MNFSTVDNKRGIRRSIATLGAEDNMKITIGIIIGVIIGAVCSGILTVNIMTASMQPRHTGNPEGCGKILPCYRVTINGIPAPPPGTNSDERIGYGTKLGGEPDWIQGVDIPVCRDCNTPMIFVAQIDSIAMADKTKPAGKDPKTNKEIQEFMFGDAGMIYVFTCFECGGVAGVDQCY